MRGRPWTLDGEVCCRLRIPALGETNDDAGELRGRGRRMLAKSPVTLRVKRGSSSFPICAQSRRAHIRGYPPRCRLACCAAWPIGDQLARARLSKPCPRATARAEDIVRLASSLLRSLLIQRRLATRGASDVSSSGHGSRSTHRGDERHLEMSSSWPSMSRILQIEPLASLCVHFKSERSGGRHAVVADCRCADVFGFRIGPQLDGIDRDRGPYLHARTCNRYCRFGANVGRERSTRNGLLLPAGDEWSRGNIRWFGEGHRRSWSTAGEGSAAVVGQSADGNSGYAGALAAELCGRYGDAGGPSPRAYWRAQWQHHPPDDDREAGGERFEG